MCNIQTTKILKCDLFDGSSEVKPDINKVVASKLVFQKFYNLELSFIYNEVKNKVIGIDDLDYLSFIFLPFKRYQELNSIPEADESCENCYLLNNSHELVDFSNTNITEESHSILKLNAGEIPSSLYLFYEYKNIGITE